MKKIEEEFRIFFQDKLEEVSRELKLATDAFMCVESDVDYDITQIIKKHEATSNDEKTTALVAEYRSHLVTLKKRGLEAAILGFTRIRDDLRLILSNGGVK